MDMNTKSLIFSALLGFAISANAETKPIDFVADTVYITVHDTVIVDLAEIEEDSVFIETDIEPSKYDKRVNRYRKHWGRLIPTNIKLQYAGNMGFMSLGFGWDACKRNQLETDLLFGYLPKFDSDHAKMTMTLKETYLPWSISFNDTWAVEPLQTGMYINTIFSDEFWGKQPSRYPENYYTFSTKIRLHIFLGQRLTINIDNDHRVFIRSLSLFYEFSTYDLMLISRITNDYLKFSDYISLSFGLKFQLL